MKTRLLIILLILTSSLRIFGVNGYSDYLIIGNDTLELYSNPYEVSASDISQFYSGEINYQIYWRLEDKKLYLVGILNRNGKRHFVDLNLIFGDDFKNGKVFANWVTGELIHPLGKRIDFYDISSYESEDVFLFDKGSFIKNYKYDNSKAYKSIFTQNNDSLFNFISNTINWETLPSIDYNKKVVSLLIVSGEEKNKFQISIMKGIDSLYNNEALRVAKLLPSWDVLYIHGQSHSTHWFLPINFSNELRFKYKKRIK